MEKFINNFGEKLNFAITGIGSLPFSNENAPKEAIDYVFDLCKNFPFWPQLPHFKTQENMALQFSQGLSGLKYNEENNKFSINNKNDFMLCLKEINNDYKTVISSCSIFEYENILNKYEITPPYSSCFDIFLNKIKTQKNRPNFIKGEVVGPFTFLKNFCEIKYDEHINNTLGEFFTLKALWQIKEFKKVSDESIPVIFTDEPALAQINPSFIKLKNEISSALKTISNTIKKFDAISGIHCCGATDWEIVTSANPNIINFDAWLYTENLSNYSKHIENFLKNGGFLALGIIPTNNAFELLNLDKKTLYERFQNSINTLSKNMDKNLILKQSFITPCCGCSSLSIDLAKKALKLAQELSTVLKKENEVKI